MKLKQLILIVFIGLAPVLKSQGLENALSGKIDIVVAQDGSGNFTTINEAINSVASNKTTRTVILVRKGNYNEKVEVASGKNKITLIGEDLDSTILVYNDYSGSGKIYNGIISSANGNAIGTSTSHSLYIDSDEFILMNMTIVNNAGPVGQAVAVNLGGDRTILVRCRILGNQDTFYTWGYGRFYMKDCFIEGNVDFIFGRGAALFDSCIINTNRNSCQITAASTDASWKFGYVFQHCKITANSGVSGVSMGRPWKDNAQTVFMNSNLGSHITGAGWSDWDGRSATCYYAEYNNEGPGAAGTRVAWSHQLTEGEAANYTMANIFAKDVNPSNFSGNWLPNIYADEVYNILYKNTDLLYGNDLQNNAELKSLKINGVDLEDFSPTKKTYNVDLIDTVTIVPAVEAEALSDISSVVIEDPESLPGNAVITVTAINGFSFTYTLKYKLTTGIREMEDASPFNILNNPFTNELQIQSFHQGEHVELALYNIAGKRVHSEVLTNSGNHTTFTINTAKLQTGFYICIINAGSVTYKHKVLKVK